MKISKLIYKFIWVISNINNRSKIARKLGVNIGANCKIYRDVSLGSEPYLISMGDNVRITNGVKFITHDGGMWVLRNMNITNKIRNAEKFNKITIGNNVHIGMNAIIMPDVKIGNNVIIGAGAVVTKDIESNSVAVGVPAKVIKSIDEYYDKNKASIDYIKHMSNIEKEKYIKDKFNIIM